MKMVAKTKNGTLKEQAIIVVCTCFLVYELLMKGERGNLLVFIRWKKWEWVKALGPIRVRFFKNNQVDSFDVIPNYIF